MKKMINGTLDKIDNEKSTYQYDKNRGAKATVRLSRVQQFEKCINSRRRLCIREAISRFVLCEQQEKIYFSQDNGCVIAPVDGEGDTRRLAIDRNRKGVAIPVLLIYCSLQCDEYWWSNDSSGALMIVLVLLLLCVVVVVVVVCDFP